MWHPVGTCRMGSDGNAVVDAGLRVNGIRFLRVIDASVMRNITSGSTNALTMALTSKGVDLVLDAQARPPGTGSPQPMKAWSRHGGA